jgi:hypothetical protein
MSDSLVPETVRFDPKPRIFGNCVLVEIGPEGGRQHNSPLEALPSSEGVTAEGPLGDGRKALSLLLPSLSRVLLPSDYLYLYYNYNYFLIL